MSTFKKKKPVEIKRRPDSEFFCLCNKTKKFKKLKSKDRHGCSLMQSLLKMKFGASENIHHDLQLQYTEIKVKGEVPKPIIDQITKDVNRTFSEHPALSDERTRRDLQELLEVIAATFPEVGYVQGMNFIAATAYYHCDIFYSYGFMLLIFDFLDLGDIFLPSKKINFF